MKKAIAPAAMPMYIKMRVVMLQQLYPVQWIAVAKLEEQHTDPYRQSLVHHTLEVVWHG